MASVEQAIGKMAERWSECIDQFAGSGCSIGKSASGRYANPAAYHVENTAGKLASYILVGGDFDDVMKELDDVARIMVLRDEPASASMVSFMKLRDVLTGEAAFSKLDEKDRDAALARLDECFLRAMDTYVQSREKILQISIEELKKRNMMLEKMQDEPYLKARGMQA
ncbi:MAG: hypothetical protein J5818_06585 [Eggerthellaceae bacterium]|nr:hypothetical protein [Eggerthellaceae bacterium]